MDQQGKINGKRSVLFASKKLNYFIIKTKKNFTCLTAAMEQINEFLVFKGLYIMFLSTPF